MPTTRTLAVCLLTAVGLGAAAGAAEAPKIAVTNVDQVVTPLAQGHGALCLSRR